MAFNFSTKDMELSERLQKEGCTVIKITIDPVDKLTKHTFEETYKEVEKILGTKLTEEKEEVKEEKESSPAPEFDSDVSGVKKKAGRPKKKKGR